MDKDKEKVLDDVGLQREFDRYIKTTISQVADHVVKKYSHSIKRPYTICVSNPDDYVCRARRQDPWYMQPYPSAKDGFSDERLLAGLDKLGETYRLIIELDFLEELPNRAIADLMDLSEKTVRNYNFFMIYSIFERVLLLLQIRAGCFHSLR